MNDQRAPRIVTFDDLVKSLSKCFDTTSRRGRKSMIHDLHDLWKMGAPIPDNRSGLLERRVLLPTQFAEWWANMANRQGLNTEFEYRTSEYSPKERD